VQKRRLQDNIKMDLGDTGFEDERCMKLFQDHANFKVILDIC
jgi:hypothetical protein